jgi:hypothetical protein
MSMGRKQRMSPGLRRLYLRREQLQKRIALLTGRIEQIRGTSHK